MTALRLLAAFVFGSAVGKAGEYAGAPPYSYQGYALVVTLVVLSLAYGTALAQQKDKP